MPEAQTGTSFPVEQRLDEQSTIPEESSETIASDFLPVSASEPQEATGNTLSKRQEGIRSGALIDVTDDAKKVGLSFPVTITKPLWEVGIASGEALTKEERSERLRDILMAFRLRLANQSTLSPLIDFPALLALPPGSIPQPVPLFALIQPDEENRALVTLLLPNEVSATIIPLN